MAEANSYLHALILPRVTVPCGGNDPNCSHFASLNRLNDLLNNAVTSSKNLDDHWTMAQPDCVQILSLAA